MRDTKQIKNLIYLYLILWVFEGALRRWVLPGLATPLLVIRDPVVLWIYYLACQRGLFPLNGFVRCSFILTFFAFIFAMVVGHGNLATAAFGTRVFFLHLPLIFIMGRVLNAEDVYKIARWSLILAIPMTMLLVIQYKSSPFAWVNRGVGGEGTAVFGGALGKNRPPGTWSFIAGPNIFYPFMTAFLFSLYSAKRAPMWLLASSGCAIFLAAPVSISRGLVLAVLIVVIVGILFFIRKGLVSAKSLFQGAGLVIFIIVITSQSAEFKAASEVFMSRWDSATTSAGGFKNSIVNRFLHGFTQPFNNLFSAPFFGYGLGLGTQAGAKLATGFSGRGFELGEVEWTRIINELGPVIGLGIIILRILLTLYLLRTAYSQWRISNAMPMLLFAAVFLLILNDAWGQNTKLGGAVIGAGLLLASTRVRKRLQNPISAT